ncbi:hypothetical protein CH373_03660 [Leptospira perolatii]|uniref:HTH tetR-type domain-containing protein n=2 Tax=Leptospira perolatii TaxID=2023191 RepID=A0A2M9ZT20_9LEPT|nr:hypothetical protein CH360_14540 [Leptospira perolatii]PJZ75119.1 hypothetical protein CH373_03660 [Leptospira perolatii]
MNKPIIRRKPSQTRSRERVDLILNTARDLIGQFGNDAVSMREIATNAGIPISSVYQYFPDKSSLLMRIMTDYFESIHTALRNEISEINDLEALFEAVPKSLKVFVNFFVEDPALSNIWAGIQADPKLVKLDADDSYRNADLFSDVILKAIPALKKSEVKPFALFFTHTVGSLVRFTLIVDQTDGKALLREAQKLIELRLLDLIRIAEERAKANL